MQKRAKRGNMHAVAIDTLISTIYEAAIDNAVWHRVADGLAAEFPWAGVSFVFRRPAMAHDLYVHAGYAPGAIEDFSANYAALCPWNDLQRDCKVGIPFATEDTLSQSAISGSRFFKDWLIPNGYGAGFGLKISDIPDCHASLVLHGTLADARTHRGDVLNLLTQLGPHLRRSVDVSRLPMDR